MTQIKSKKAKEYILSIVEPVPTPEGELVFYVEMTPAQVVKAISLAETEAEECHANELQELKDKAIEAYISTCIKNENGVCCIDAGECPVNCHRVELFTQKLNEQ